MSKLPDDCVKFLTTLNLLHHQEFFFDLGIASFDDFFDIESKDLTGYLKPLEERRFLRAVSVTKSEPKREHMNDESTEKFEKNIPETSCCEETVVHEQNNPDEVKNPNLQSEAATQQDIGTPQMSTLFDRKRMYSHAADKRMKLWSDFQIKNAYGLEKKRREFYNMKVNELCAVSTIRKSWTKTEISGAADTAWVLKKTALLQVESAYIQELTGEKSKKTKRINNQEKPRGNVA